MAVSLTTLGTRMTAATAAAVATAVGGGTTADEITALIQLLTVMGARPGESVPLLKLTGNSNLTPS